MAAVVARETEALHEKVLAAGNKSCVGCNTYIISKREGSKRCSDNSGSCCCVSQAPSTGPRSYALRAAWLGGVIIVHETLALRVEHRSTARCGGYGTHPRARPVDTHELSSSLLCCPCGNVTGAFCFFFFFQQFRVVFVSRAKFFIRLSCCIWLCACVFLPLTFPGMPGY